MNLVREQQPAQRESGIILVVLKPSNNVFMYFLVNLYSHRRVTSCAVNINSYAICNRLHFYANYLHSIDNDYTHNNYTMIEYRPFHSS